MTKREALVIASYEQVNKGIYVWGGRGQDVSAMSEAERVKWITRRENSMDTAPATIKENIKRDLALYSKRVSAGVNPILAFDCSGFEYWCQLQAKVGYARRNAATIYKDQCDPIQEDDLQSADLVFHHDGTKIAHVGIYVGDGKVNECKGRDVGVVTTDFAHGKWNRFGRLKKLKSEYDPTPAPEPAPEPIPEPTPVPESYVYVKGGSVYVREGDNKNTKMIGIAHRGDKLPYVGTSPDTGWYNVIFKWQNGWISNRDDLTKLV